ncbi:hypothetical protein BT67DRAFT_453887 [Trichocladium antarcticum]|uniref:Elongator complex protein 5 n=1 Tax=Trichocladium antarcticum TaxID=1450529 RepID=A0AAN6UTK0_9PEZI|nr:hypothetical protein BT67DRAFT_453887 [Trichocladium antarcticum]
MSISALSIDRNHKRRLLQNILNQKDNASPLTLILDSLEQSAQPLVQEFMRAAKVVRRAKVIFVSFATVKKPPLADVLIKGRGKSLEALSKEITACVANKEEHLIILDTLNPLAASTPSLLPAFLASIIHPTTALVAVYHTDIPALLLPHDAAEYAPHAQTLLTHLATTVLRVSSLYQAILALRAQRRSERAPEWGLRERREGALVGTRQWSSAVSRLAGEGDVVVEMEMRRKSGRAVVERFVLAAAAGAGATGRRGGGGGGGPVVLVMAEHPEFDTAAAAAAAAGETEDGGMEATFDLGLTEKQRRDREGVVLPYFDAQTEVGGGEGGRILYDFGREDDFDEEEDEI